VHCFFSNEHEKRNNLAALLCRKQPGIGIKMAQMFAGRLLEFHKQYSELLRSDDPSKAEELFQFKESDNNLPPITLLVKTALADRTSNLPSYPEFVSRFSTASQWHPVYC
jgi:hypothetical protein